jgi:hypothetical protein
LRLVLVHVSLFRLRECDFEDAFAKSQLNMLLIGGLAAVFALFTPAIQWIASLPHFCVFEQLLKIPCPGCDITLATLTLLDGNFRRSLDIHPGATLISLVVGAMAMAKTLFLSKFISMLQMSSINEGGQRTLLVGLLALWLHRLVSNF